MIAGGGSLDGGYGNGERGTIAIPPDPDVDSHAGRQRVILVRKRRLQLSPVRLPRVSAFGKHHVAFGPWMHLVVAVGPCPDAMMSPTWCSGLPAIPETGDRSSVEPGSASSGCARWPRDSTRARRSPTCTRWWPVKSISVSSPSIPLRTTMLLLTTAVPMLFREAGTSRITALVVATGDCAHVAQAWKVIKAGVIEVASALHIFRPARRRVDECMMRPPEQVRCCVAHCTSGRASPEGLVVGVVRVTGSYFGLPSRTPINGGTACDGRSDNPTALV